jgi:hypothetical protein
MPLECRPLDDGLAYGAVSERHIVPDGGLARVEGVS